MEYGNNHLIFPLHPHHDSQGMQNIGIPHLILLALVGFDGYLKSFIEVH
jgi:hypothetical protein